MIYIGLDDTDNLESRGTGHLARAVASVVADTYRVAGVTRHQLLVDPQVPYTKHNSSACILLETGRAVEQRELDALFDRVRWLVLADFQPGSDPGLCLAAEVPAAIGAFGRRAQREVVRQEEARALAAAHGVRLRGLGGTEGGVIGALAAVGLAAGGDDGRYVLVGSTRELAGLQPVPALLAAGVVAVETAGGQPVADGLVRTDKLRPARRRGQPIAVVEWGDGHWEPLKLD